MYASTGDGGRQGERTVYGGSGVCTRAPRGVGRARVVGQSAGGCLAVVTATRRALGRRRRDGARAGRTARSQHIVRLPFVGRQTRFAAAGRGRRPRENRPRSAATRIQRVHFTPAPPYLGVVVSTPLPRTTPITTRAVVSLKHIQKPNRIFEGRRTPLYGIFKYF